MSTFMLELHLHISRLEHILHGGRIHTTMISGMDTTIGIGDGVGMPIALIGVGVGAIHFGDHHTITMDAAVMTGATHITITEEVGVLIIQMAVAVRLADA